MRMIGHIGSETDARVFSDYLYVQGIKNQVEREGDGSWAVWVHSEDEVDQAKSHLQRFAARPNDPGFRSTASQAADKREKEKKSEAAAAARMFESRDIFRHSGPFGMGMLTTVIIAICVVVYIANNMLGNKQLEDLLRFSQFNYVKTFPEIRHGQIWRIITPIFLHATILHILFNMLWMRDLGSMVEARKGAGFLAAFVLIVAAVSNTAQYVLHGPNFVGISGVVYGLFGYVWMKSKFDPASGMFLHPSTVTMMLIWFAICFTGILPIANTIHTVGLVIGVIWGYITSPSHRR